MFVPLNLPEFTFSFKQDKTNTLIFDEIRNKYVVCTPEEWVRQNFIKFLIKNLNYPKTLMSLEMPFKVNTTSKRSDIVVFDRSGSILMIVECKAPTVKVVQKTFDQAAVYNIKLKAKYLIVTNGLEHYCCKVDFENKRWEFITEIPDFNVISLQRD
jgi:hypothetical protein